MFLLKRWFLLLVLLAAIPAHATTYFMATAAGGGSDANNGTSSGTPWLSPNHAVNCGDVILAAASVSYVAANFQTWGTVTCAAGNNVAWVKCTTAFACTVTGTSTSAIFITASYWGVQGFITTTPSTDQVGHCIVAYPSGGSIHHIIIANDIANSCGGEAFGSANNGSNGVDYIEIIGNIAYGAATAPNGFDTSGISVAAPVNSDTLPGTHIMVAGNFIWNNIDASVGQTDGEGIILDTIQGQGYTGQILVSNNISFLNGSFGLESYSNNVSKIYLRNNTLWSNTGNRDSSSICGDLQFSASLVTEAYNNLIAEQSASGCGGNSVYAMSVYNGNGTDHAYNNWAYGISSQNTQVASSAGFSFGPNNTLGTSPAFANAPATNPGAPSCGGFATVIACMATIIADFVPTAAGAAAYGYMKPSTTSIYDPLYPQWLCSVTNLPTGLVTPGCVTGSFVGSGAQIH